MKTLLISEIFPPIHGGSGRWFWELYSRLPKNDYVIAAGQSARAQAFDKNQILNIERINLTSPAWGIISKTGLRFYWRSFWKLKKIIEKHSITKVHCGRCLPEGVMGLLLKKFLGISYLCYIHGEDIETATTSRELKKLVSWVLGNAEILICNSHSTSDTVKDHWPGISHKIQILNPGVDSKRFIPAPDCQEVRKNLGWPLDHTIILTVGRLQRRKGHDVMIKAMKQIIGTRPNTTYVIVGEGDQMTNLQGLVSEHGLQRHILFSHELDDEALIQSYQQCDIFILPNRRDGADIEGFGMVLVEAQSCGEPVIAGNSGGTAETMIEGQTGHVIDCTKVESIVEAFNTLFNDKTKLIEMGEAARQHVMRTLDWQAHTKEALSYFNKIP